MKKLLLLFIIGGAAWYWNGGKIPFLSPAGAFDASGKPVVWVFTFADCGAPCLDTLRSLKQRQVAFEEKQVNPKDPESTHYKTWKKYRTNRFPLIAVGNETSTYFNEAQIVSLLASQFGETYLNPLEKRYFRNHFNADGSPRIVMYGVDWCGYCAALRKEFKDNNVEYIEIDVEKSGEKQVMLQTMQISGYPATWVGFRRVMGTNLSAIKKEQVAELTPTERLLKLLSSK